MTAEQVDAGFVSLQEQMGVSLEVLYCPHAAGPPKCWCRKPLPGWASFSSSGIDSIRRNVSTSARGRRTLASRRRLGFQYREAGEFFGCYASTHATLS